MRSTVNEPEGQDRIPQFLTKTAGVVVGTFLIGLVLRDTLILSEPHAARTQGRAVVTPIASSSRQPFEATKLPPFVFHATNYKFSDPALRSFQDAINRQGIRMAHGYAGIRSALLQVAERPANRKSIQWRRTFDRSLLEFRTAGALLGDSPVVPEQARAEDKAFAHAADLSAEIADQIEASVIQNSSDENVEVPREIKRLSIVIGMAQGGLGRLAYRLQSSSPGGHKSNSPTKRHIIRPLPEVQEPQ